MAFSWGKAGAMERGLGRGTWVAFLRMSTHHYVPKVLNVQVLVPLHWSMGSMLESFTNTLQI